MVKIHWVCKKCETDYQDNFQNGKCPVCHGSLVACEIKKVLVPLELRFMELK